MTRTLYIDGVTRRRVDDLLPGDRVDLENDVIADPEGHASDGEFSNFQFEFEVVGLIERESDDCIRIDFESGFSCGFPPDHLIDVDGEQPDPEYRYDFDRLSGTGIIVRLADDLTTLRYTGTEAADLCDMRREQFEALAAEQEFS